MYTTLLCIMLFASDWPRDSTGQIAISGTTDNLGNTGAVAKLMTSKFPSVVVLTEVTAWLEKLHLDMHLRWAPRDQNEHADSLTNDDLDEFDPARRIAVDPARLPFLVLNQFLGVSEELYKATQEDKAAGRARGAAPGPRKKLRETQPW